MLLALLVAAGLPASPQPSVPEGEVDAPGELGTAQDRPFTHRDHQGVACLECHGTGGDHGVVTVQTARDCAACHHDPDRGYTCEACHASAELPPPGPVATDLALTVWDAPRSRDLPFDHAAHQGVSCDACHTGPVMLEVETGCTACHQDHHRPESDCGTCHTPGEPGAHGLEVHQSCVSAGCHAQEVGERPTLTRSLCLMCHTDQQEHEPGLECHHCHMIPHDPSAETGVAVRELEELPGWRLPARGW